MGLCFWFFCERRDTPLGYPHLIFMIAFAFCFIALLYYFVD